MKELTVEDFDGFILDNSRVLAEFWAPWCAACKPYGALLEEIEREERERAAREDEEPAAFAKVDVSDQPEIADRYGIVGLPTVIFFQGGGPVFKESGVLPKQRLLSVIK